MYQVQQDGKEFDLGTSGFLYRSNKLMYDMETRSLWSTLQGIPVVGPLVDQGIRLQRLPVITTNWAAWRSQHPETTVVSIETGYQRDYGEGVAYRDYFASDDLMFDVPVPDSRLRNKHEVVALRNDEEQLAISREFLRQHPVYHDSLGTLELVVLTDAAGANRVYESTGVRFTTFDGQAVTDVAGEQWAVLPDRLQLGSRTLPRVAGHRAFWFGWVAQFPRTRLVK